MSTLSEESQANVGWVYPATPEVLGDRYHPEIIAILTVDGVPSLEGLTTANRPITETLIDIVVEVSGTPEAQQWRLDSGAANPLDPGEVEPFDYNVATNNKHWVKVG